MLLCVVVGISRFSLALPSCSRTVKLSAACACFGSKRVNEKLKRPHQLASLAGNYTNNQRKLMEIKSRNEIALICENYSSMTEISI